MPWEGEEAYDAIGGGGSTWAVHVYWYTVFQSVLASSQ